MTVPRLLAGVHSHRPLSLDEHRAVHGPPSVSGEDLVESVRLAGLRGRGGASFPTAVKLRSVALQARGASVLVNAAEGEPMSRKDRVLLERTPHLVLDGAFAVADVIGAERVVVAVPELAVRAAEAVGRALAERSQTRRASIATVPVAYLAGEETALINYLEGGALKPRFVPPRPFERGLRGRPTLVQNPETLAHLALIARYGSAWFREVGTEDHPGSTLVTVAGAVARPGVHEIGCGTPLGAVIEEAGGPTDHLRAVLVGGYHGTWLPASVIPSVRLEDSALAAYGASLAAGILVALGESACPARELAGTMSWLAAQSAHQCGPCRNGLPALAELLGLMADGRAPSDSWARLERWGRQVVGRGACHLPDGAMRFLASGLTVFASEVADHERFGPCDACHHPLTLSAAPRRERAAA